MNNSNQYNITNSQEIATAQASSIIPIPVKEPSHCEWATKSLSLSLFDLNSQLFHFELLSLLTN